MPDEPWVDPTLEMSTNLLGGFVSDVLANPSVPDDVKSKAVVGEGYTQCPHCQGIIVTAVANLPMPQDGYVYQVMGRIVPAELAEQLIIDPNSN